MPIDYRPLIYKSCIGRANRERADLEGVAPETDEVEGKATEILKAAKARLRNLSEMGSPACRQAGHS